MALESRLHVRVLSEGGKMKEKRIRIGRGVCGKERCLKAVTALLQFHPPTLPPSLPPSFYFHLPLAASAAGVLPEAAAGEGLYRTGCIRWGCSLALLEGLQRP